MTYKQSIAPVFLLTKMATSKKIGKFNSKTKILIYCVTSPEREPANKKDIIEAMPDTPPGEK